MKVFEVPVSLPEWLVAVTVELAPDWVSVTEVVASTPAEFRAFIKEETERLAMVIRSANISLD